ASGGRPFRGTSILDLSAAILRDPIPELPGNASQQIRPIIQRCLAKNVGQRYQSAGEVRAALDALTAASSTSLPIATPVVSRRRWILTAGSVAVLGVAALVGIFEWRQPRTYGPIPSKVPEANEYLRLAQYALDTQQEAGRVRALLEQALKLDPKFSAARVLYG